MSNEKFEAQTSSIYAEQVMTNQYLHDLADDLQDEIGQRRAQFDSLSEAFDNLEKYVEKELGEYDGLDKITNARIEALNGDVEDGFEGINSDITMLKIESVQLREDAEHNFINIQEQLNELANDCKKHEHAIADFGHGVVVLDSKLKEYHREADDKLTCLRAYAREGLLENKDEIKHVKENANGLFFLLLLANVAMWICHFAGWL